LFYIYLYYKTMYLRNQKRAGTILTIAVSSDLLLFIIIKSIDSTAKRWKQNRCVPFGW